MIVGDNVSGFTVEEALANPNKRRKRAEEEI